MISGTVEVRDLPADADLRPTWRPAKEPCETCGHAHTDDNPVLVYQRYRELPDSTPEWPHWAGTLSERKFFCWPCGYSRPLTAMSCWPGIVFEFESDEERDHYLAVGQ